MLLFFHANGYAGYIVRGLNGLGTQDLVVPSILLCHR